MYLTYFIFIINLNICIVLLRYFFFFLKFVADFLENVLEKEMQLLPLFLPLLMAV